MAPTYQLTNLSKKRKQLAAKMQYDRLLATVTIAFLFDTIHIGIRIIFYLFQSCIQLPLALFQVR